MLPKPLDYVQMKILDTVRNIDSQFEFEYLRMNKKDVEAVFFCFD